jgi:hypothetical protein
VGNGESLLPAPHRDVAGASIRASARFQGPPPHPGQRDFPDPVGNEDYPRVAFPKASPAQVVADIHCSDSGLPRGSPDWTTIANSERLYLTALARPLAPTVLAQGPFALVALPPFLAHMGPCADPDASHNHFSFRPYRPCPCRLRHLRLVTGTVPTFGLLFSPEVLRPIRRRLVRCSQPVLP